MRPNHLNYPTMWVFRSQLPDIRFYIFSILENIISINEMLIQELKSHYTVWKKKKCHYEKTKLCGKLFILEKFSVIYISKKRANFISLLYYI